MSEELTHISTSVCLLPVLDAVVSWPAAACLAFRLSSDALKEAKMRL